MEPDIYTLYQIINLVNDSRYIGITNNISRREREHWSNSSNKSLNADIEKYGKANFVLQTISTHSREDIDNVERAAIKSYLEQGYVLYNVSKGGLIGNGAPGSEHWNHELSDTDIVNIRLKYATNAITQRDLAILYNTGFKNISKIVRGERWGHVEGPITSERKEISKVANRRKLTDIQVTQVRYEAQEEFSIIGTVSIPEIAEVYGVSRGSMRMILKGISYKELPGPIIGIDYYKDFGRGS